MKVTLMLIAIIALIYGDLPVSIVPREGEDVVRPAPGGSPWTCATLVSACGDIRAILGPQGKNIAVCRHGDVIATIFGAPTGNSSYPMCIKIAYSTNSGTNWTSFGPFTGNLIRCNSAVAGSPDFCTTGDVYFCYMKYTGSAQFPIEVIVEENVPHAPSPSPPFELPGSDTLSIWQPGIAVAPDNPHFVIIYGWSHLNNHFYLWFSKDGANTWFGPFMLGVTINPGYGGNSGPVLDMGDNGYIAGIFNNSVGGITNDGWPHFIESVDSGKTWLPQVILPVPHFDSTNGMFWWHEIEAEVVNNKPWLIANDIGGSGFWLYHGNGSPGNWTWTTWDLGVIGACSTYVADTLFQLIPGQYGSLCYDPVSGMILATYKGLAYIVQGGTNVLCNGPAVCGVYTLDEGVTWNICRPLSVWNTLTYSNWNATETAHRLANIDGDIYAYTLWIHNTNFNLYFEGGTTNNGLVNTGFGVNEVISIDLSHPTLRISPTVCSQRCQMQFELPAECPVSLKIYDRCGRLVENLLDRRMAAGRHELTVNTSGYPAGVYFVTLESNGLRQAAKIIINR